MTNSSAIKTASRKGSRPVVLWPETSTATKWTSGIGAWKRDDGIVSPKIKGLWPLKIFRIWEATSLSSLSPRSCSTTSTSELEFAEGRHCLKIASKFLRWGWFASLAWSDSCTKAARRAKGSRNAAGREARSLTDSKDWFTLETLRADCKDSTVWRRFS